MSYTYTSGQKVRIKGHARWLAGTFKCITVNGLAEIRFRKARRPLTCERCGSFTLSRNTGSGEITCMRTGCGHDHGFDTIVEELTLESIEPFETSPISATT